MPIGGLPLSFAGVLLLSPLRQPWHRVLEGFREARSVDRWIRTHSQKLQDFAGIALMHSDH
jgi:hypothetical protein